ncbi:glycine cleavage system H protein 2, mitochondrial-like [Camellia sinensis]|uniref:glycine cleavage system H protein 2, mitochondrial-like n=1 Tax=Camellia sinensis TaxID=4442 RepID=UPI0010359CE0|nr:glycine cleavage system H protein 2, mitochondrial-like [Camellia sinensis]
MASRLWASRVASQLRISVFNRGFASVVKDFKYANSHEWVKVDGKSATVGITDHAQDHLGDVVYVELPEVGVAVTQGGSFGAVESVKATSDIYSPVSGPPFDKKLFVAYIKKYIKLLTPKLEGDKQEECKKKMQRVGRDDANEGIKKKNTSAAVNDY